MRIRALGDARYAGVLADHRRLLRAPFAEEGGEEAGTQGEVVLANFAAHTERFRRPCGGSAFDPQPHPTPKVWCRASGWVCTPGSPIRPRVNMSASTAIRLGGPS